MDLAGAEAYSAMVLAPVMSRPRQDDFRCMDPASVKGALRSVPREFDTRPVSMNLHHPAAIDFPSISLTFSAERFLHTTWHRIRLQFPRF
jgi:hypothetical protein